MTITSTHDVASLQAPVFHRASTAGTRIGVARRYLAEADQLADDADHLQLCAALRASLRREASLVTRSAERALLDVAH